MASSPERQQSSESSPSSSDNENRGPPEDHPPDTSSLSQAIKARRTEYIRQQSIRVKVGSWNVAALPGTEEDIGKWFVQKEGICEHLSGLKVSGLEEAPSSDSGNNKTLAQHDSEPHQVGLYVLGLQEIVDVSSPAETLRPYVDPAPANRWKEAVQRALPSGYRLVAETQLVGLLLLIYAAPSLADSVSCVSCANVGTGLLGYMGNKGAVAARLLIGETTCLLFVNSHLAAGADKSSLDRRNWDASQIVARARFDPIDTDAALKDDPTESIGKEDFCFWFGDLNYRLEDIPGDDVRQVLARHTENEYDKRHKSHAVSDDPTARPPDDGHEQLPTVSDEQLDPHTDPASLQTTLSSLLPHDQLRLQQEKHKAFHEGWREGDISFLPTYKYDVGSVAKFDSSEKQRGPSWCDRILYRTRRDMLIHEKMVKEAAEARKRDEEMKARGLDKAAADDNVLFDYDPDVDGAESGDEYDPALDFGSDNATLDSLPDAEDPLKLDYYVSHQGILSSDHKPLAAGFTLKYESVVPDLKAKIHQEVVRELDKVENESRPGLTVVVDHHGQEASNKVSETDPNAMDFGEIAFDVPVSRTLTVANTSGVAAAFTFERPEHDGQKLPTWCEFHVEPPHRGDAEILKTGPEPREYTLLPGELTNIEVTAQVKDIELARALNNRETTLEEILVLRVANGRDHFIPAYGKWLPTCFGRSLEELTLMPESGARSLVVAELPERHTEGTEVPLSAPRELFRLTEAVSELTERAVAEWSMVRGDSTEDCPPWENAQHGPGWPFEPSTWLLKDEEERTHLSASVREALDTNRQFSAAFAPEVSSLHRLEILSETLLVFLTSLKDGIVSAPVWHDLDQEILAREKAKMPPRSWEESQAWILENLAYSPVHSVSFTFVTFMLARIANEVAPVSSMPSGGARSTISEEQPKDTAQHAKSVDATPSTPVSPAAAFISGGSFRRRTRASTVSSVSDTAATTLIARRQAVETTLAGIFSKVLISTKVPVPSKEKERRALDDRKRSIVEPFLKNIGVDANGPSGGV
ncbi:Endonuclease/exonuclease/phosphatase [Aspergillus ambiguus]|uniref:phosphatase family protein n=1 Tax=Aspergillus ambiguus TaxID=176160 RepID=UPI003CCE20F9